MENTTGVLELKYNPWHDNEDGKFTFSNHGSYAGGVSGGGIGGSRISTISSKPLKLKKPIIFTGGGGSYGGGGTSGSWDKPTPKKPAPLPKREIVKTPKPSALGQGSRIKTKSPNRKITAGGYHFEADRQDRTVRASGQLRLKADQRRSRSAQSNAGKPDRLPKDHGGHFIGRQFGGPEISYNHFAQNARFNNSDYKTLENDWKRELKAGKKVRVDIRALYRENSNRPSNLNVTYYVSGKRGFRSFPNPK